MTEEILKEYDLLVDYIPVKVKIFKTTSKFVPVYKLDYPKIESATMAILESIRESIISELDIAPSEVMDPKEVEVLKKKFMEKTLEKLEKNLPHLPQQERKILTGVLTHKSLGMGEIELLLSDDGLEEIVINGSKEPIWVYHRQFGWLKTTLMPGTEVDIYNYAALIGRRVGSQITHLNPLMDAYLTTGDRANATLFPISTLGNTLTIRKFAAKPWTITDFIENKTISLEMAAFIWLAIQFEMNMIITGGTASGKTALLGVLSTFIPPSHRIITIEDTREMQLPTFLHWVPMTTRPPNPEGKGEVTMLDLMVNALRMRPDRILVGEIRRSREAEVLFEAIHTGHSVYSTFHANTDEETIRRLLNPPINIAPSLLSSLHMIVVMHRDRRKEIRRVMSVSEIVGSGTSEAGITINKVYEWLPSKDTFIKPSKSFKVLNDIKFFSGMTEKAMEQNLLEKQEILKWLVDSQIKDVNEVGKIISQYYLDPNALLKTIRSGGPA